MIFCSRAAALAAVALRDPGPADEPRETFVRARRASPGRKVPVLVLCAALAGAETKALASVPAADPAREERVSRAHTLWEYARQPGLRRAEIHTALAQAYWRQALDPRVPEHLSDAALREARTHFVAALELAPEYVPALLGLADLLQSLGEYTHSLALFVRARDLVGEAPERRDVLFGLGNELTRARRFEEARDTYEDLLSLPLDGFMRAVTLNNLGETYVYLGDLSQALAAYRGAIEVQADFAGAWWGLASTADRDGREEESARAARHALALDPSLHHINGEGVFYAYEYEMHYRLAIAYETQGRTTDAMQEWQRFLDGGGSREPWAYRAMQHIARLREGATRSRH